MSPEIINPRRLLAEKQGKKRLFDLISAAGYVPQQIPFNAMCNAIYMATPLLLEGHRGGGKTAFPEALAKALKLRLFTLPCLHDTTTDHILFSWDSAGQHHFVGQEILKGTPLDAALERQWGTDFLKLGEVLDAFFYSARSGNPSVLLIDEIDKLSQDAESALLQILARGFANVPQLRPDARVGFIPEYDRALRRLAYPIVVLTSNNMGSGVSSPLRSRARYSVINPPSIEEMVRILAVSVPAAPARLVYHTAKLIRGVTGLPLLEQPALREFIMLLETFVAYGYTYLTAEIIESNLDCLAKTKKDVESIADSVDMLFRSYVEKDDQNLEALVAEIFRHRQAHRSGQITAR